MNTRNENIILGVAGNEKDARTIYETARLLGESVFDATVIRLDEERGKNTATAAAAVRNRIRNMYFPDGVKTFVVAAQKVAEEVRSAIEELGAKVITLNSQTSPEQVIAHIRGQTDVQAVV